MSSRYWKRCCSGPERFCHGGNWRIDCTASMSQSAAMRWRSLRTRTAPQARQRGHPNAAAAWATSSQNEVYSRTPVDRSDIAGRRGLGAVRVSDLSAHTQRDIHIIRLPASADGIDAAGADLVGAPDHPARGSSRRRISWWQIWDVFGARSYSSRPGLPVSNQIVLGYADLDLRGQPWRAYGLQTADGVIQVAQPARIRQELARAAALRVVIPLLLLLPFMILCVMWGGATGTNAASLPHHRGCRGAMPAPSPR